MPNNLELEFRISNAIIKRYNEGKYQCLIIKAAHNLKSTGEIKIKAYGMTAGITYDELGDPCPMPCDDETTSTQTSSTSSKSYKSSLPKKTNGKAAK